jgi:hypothetical protein
MRKRAFAALVLAAPLALLSTPAAGQQEDPLDKVINNPLPANFRVDGLRDKPKVRSDPNVQWNKALRVEVPGKAPNAWAIAVAVPIKKAVKAGDKLVLAFWARLEKGENGATSTTLPYNAVQMGSAPYTALFSGPITIDSTWKLQQVEGRAAADYPADTLNATIHLATAKQVVDIGPVFVLDMGQ